MHILFNSPPSTWPHSFPPWGRSKLSLISLWSTAKLLFRSFYEWLVFTGTTSQALPKELTTYANFYKRTVSSSQLLRSKQNSMTSLQPSQALTFCCDIQIGPNLFTYTQMRDSLVLALYFCKMMTSITCGPVSMQAKRLHPPRKDATRANRNSMPSNGQLNNGALIFWVENSLSRPITLI